MAPALSMREEMAALGLVTEVALRAWMVRQNPESYRCGPEYDVAVAVAIAGLEPLLSRSLSFSTLRKVVFDLSEGNNVPTTVDLVWRWLESTD